MPHRSILVRCDASAEIGLGHVVRCLAVADALRARGAEVAFAMRRGPLGFQLVEERGFAVHRGDGEQRAWLDRTLYDTNAAALIVDVRDELSRADLESLRERLIVSLDDPGDRRLAAHLAFYPPVPQVGELDWSGFTGRLHVGWQWVALRKSFSATARAGERTRPSILVTMGGSDPARLTFKVIDALALVAGDWDATVIVGRGFAWRDELEAGARRLARPVEVRHGVDDMAGAMASADLAVASFGVTAYELAAMGVPAIHLCLTDDHARSASVFSQIAVSLGLHNRVSPPQLAGEINRLLDDAAARHAMSVTARALVDGKGSERIAEEILSHLEMRR